jgi:hypothetical protein
VDNTTAENIKIISREGGFNGIIATGDQRFRYTIVKPMIILAGNGGDDATGRGHGIMASGHAEVFVDDAKIYSAGANRSALFVGGSGILHVSNSKIEVANGQTFVPGSGGIIEAPWHLGITGNCRAARVVEDGSAYYTDTHITSQAWGVLSTGGSGQVRLDVTGCLIETVDSGYGAGSTGGGTHTYSGCTFNVADYGLIIGGDATHIITGRTAINSEKIGVMMHTGTSSGRLIIEKGSACSTKGTVIQVKGRGADILVDGAILNTESGVILQSMPSDDPFVAVHMTDGLDDHDNGRDVNAVFKNTVFQGDIINSNVAGSPMDVTFENATITGAITTGITEQPPGPDGENLSRETPELYYLIGQTRNTYCPRFEQPHGIRVSLDERSAWIVNKTSYLNRLRIAKNRSVTAPYGYRVTMTVDGNVTHLNAGTYEGEIVLTVSRL